MQKLSLDTGKRMEQQVSVVTDNIACLTRECIDRFGIEIIPVNFYANGRLYRDWVDITPSEAYELFLKDPESFHTSAPSPEDCLAAFRKASQKARNVICVTVSLHISGVYNSVMKARELAASQLPNIKIEILDSETATAAEGFVALAAARIAAQGKSLSEALEASNAVKSKVHCIIFMDTIKHVYRSGRIPKFAAQAGSILNIRPILTVSNTVHFAAAVRSRAAGVERLLQMMKSKVGQNPVHVSVMHAYALDDAKDLMKKVDAQFNCAEVWLSEFSPIMGYATGTGTLGLAFYSD